MRDWFANLDKILFLWIGCFAVNIITLLFLYYKIHPGNKVLALHYNVLVGVDWYGKGKNLYSLPLVAFLLTGINVVIYNMLKRRQFFLSLLSALISLFVQTILLIATLLLAKLN